jgi:hypothetical protein
MNELARRFYRFLKAAKAGGQECPPYTLHHFVAFAQEGRDV